MYFQTIVVNFLVFVGRCGLCGCFCSVVVLVHDDDGIIIKLLVMMRDIMINFID